MAYNTRLGYDPEIKDYAAAIANTVDKAARDSLLQQRQNKIDHLTATGQMNSDWVGNDIVSTWTSTYQPGGWNDDTASYNPLPQSSSGPQIRYNEIYAQQQAAYQQQMQEYQRQMQLYQQQVAQQMASQQAAMAQQMQSVMGMVGNTQPVQQSYDDYLALLRQQYEKAEREQRAAVQAAVDRGVSELSGQVGSIHSGYDDLAREAYIAYMQGKKQLPYSLAAGGLTGGVSESSEVALSAAYQETLNRSERERQAALAGVDSEIAELKASGSLKEAEAAAANATDYASAVSGLYGEMLDAQRAETQRLTNLAMWAGETMLDQQKAASQMQLAAYQQAQENARWQAEQLLQSQKLAYQQEQDAWGRQLDSWDQEQENWERQMALAETLADVGDFSGYRALG
ncbi:MAG: hypothetical protein IJF59_04670, partial [Clostridia bacterium]|nr:hypothetical protein [Clostridia bacterium]